MAAKTKKIQKFCSFCSFFALWTRRVFKNLFVFCEVILYIAHTKTRGTEERGREELVGVFFIFFCYCAFVVSFGRRKRARNFEFSFVRSLFPHCIIIISRRDERTTLLLTTTTREKERKNKRDLRVWARVFCRFLLPRITFIIDRRRRRNI